jgi:thiamine-monophosphate kinase
MRLRKVGEDQLLAQLFPAKRRRSRSVIRGVGDDCAVVESTARGNCLLLKTDCLVEGIHFTARTPAVAVGWKAMARPLSDFAAMSGVPRFALVTLIIPGSRTLDWAKKLYQGLKKAAQAFDVEIVGGETSATKGPIVLSVSVTGFVEKARWVGRGGGKAGDDLFVTGRLGGSIRGKHLRFVPRIVESRWLTGNFSIHAMMDLSDGLGTDLPRLARASGVGFEVKKTTIPRNRGCSVECALSDGEDYELLFAVSPDQSGRLVKQWRKKFPRLPLTRIGRLKARLGTRSSKLPAGYVHFK